MAVVIVAIVVVIAIVVVMVVVVIVVVVVVGGLAGIAGLAGLAENQIPTKASAAMQGRFAEIILTCSILEPKGRRNLSLPYGLFLYMSHALSFLRLVESPSLLANQSLKH